MTTTTTHVPSRQSAFREALKAVNDAWRGILPAVTGVEARILLAIFALVGLWGLAIATWGYPALIGVAVCLVPVMFGVLLLITVGK